MSAPAIAMELAGNVGAQQLVERAEELLQDRDIAAALAAFDKAEADGGDPDRCSGGRWMGHTCSQATSPQHGARATPFERAERMIRIVSGRVRASTAGA